MKATLKYRYVILPHIKLKLKNRPIGTMARRNTLPVIFTVFRPSSSVVVRARIWVISVAKARCHVVRIIATVAIDVSEGNVPFQPCSEVRTEIYASPSVSVIA